MADRRIWATVAHLTGSRHRDAAEMHPMDITVSLDDELARFVEGQIAMGHFRSSSDLMREALRLMETIERQGRRRPPMAARGLAGRPRLATALDRLFDAAVQAANRCSSDFRRPHRISLRSNLLLERAFL